MSQIEPPPNIVQEFVYIWKDWLYRLWTFIQDHTGGSSTGGTGSGSDWNAHGNDAVGGNFDPLTISVGAFQINSQTGRPTTDLDDGVGYAFIPARRAIRSGEVPSLTNYWVFSNIGSYSNAFGLNVNATGEGGTVFGKESDSSGDYSFLAGLSNNSTGYGSILLGNNNTDSTSASNLAGNAILIGKNNTGSGNSDCVAIGRLNTTTDQDTSNIGAINTCGGLGGVTVGTYNTTSGGQSTAIGFNNTASTKYSSCIGAMLKASGKAAVTIGSGYYKTTIPTATYFLDNTDDYTLWMGVGSDVPTFILKNDTPGTTSVAKIGIVAQDPKSTFEVAGSTGYKYTSLAAGTSKVIGASDQELIFLCDCTSGGGGVTIELPLVADVDRRIYHLKKIRTTSASPSDGLVVNVASGSGNTIENATGGGNGLQGGSTTTFGGNGADIMLLADSTASGGLGGWWIL